MGVESIFESQYGTCGVCKNVEWDSWVDAVIDHDHKCCDRPGSCGYCVRGLLCQSCNAQMLPGYEALPPKSQTWDWLNEYLARRPIQDMRNAAKVA